MWYGRRSNFRRQHPLSQEVEGGDRKSRDSIVMITTLERAGMTYGLSCSCDSCAKVSGQCSRDDRVLPFQSGCERCYAIYRNPQTAPAALPAEKSTGTPIVRTLPVHLESLTCTRKRSWLHVQPQPPSSISSDGSATCIPLLFCSPKNCNLPQMLKPLRTGLSRPPASTRQALTSLILALL